MYAWQIFSFDAPISNKQIIITDNFSYAEAEERYLDATRDDDQLIDYNYGIEYIGESKNVFIDRMESEKKTEIQKYSDHELKALKRNIVLISVSNFETKAMINKIPDIIDEVLEYRKCIEIPVIKNEVGR